MCCPGRSVTAPPPSPPAGAPAPRLALTGLQVMEYSGIYAMKEYQGLSTRVFYPFGRERPRGYVDARDVQGFVELVEYGKTVFNVPTPG